MTAATIPAEHLGELVEDKQREVAFCEEVHDSLLMATERAWQALLDARRDLVGLEAQVRTAAELEALDAQAGGTA